MPIRSTLTDHRSQEALATNLHYDQRDRFSDDDRMLVVTDPSSAYSTFRAVSGTGAGVVSVVAPPPGGSLIVSDLLISGDRRTNGSVTLRFTDGTNTINIFKAITTDAPVAISIPFEGRVQGWRNARLEIDVINNVEYSVMATFIKIREGLPFAEWDKLR